MSLPASLPEPSRLPGASSPTLEPLTLLEHVPMTAYLLRAQGDDFVLEGVNAAARAKTPALRAREWLSRSISRPIHPG